MNVNMVLFDDFEAMDVCGPAEIFGKLQQYFHVRYLSVSGDVVNSVQGTKIWTDFLVPDEIDGILLIPGGKGARRLLWQDERTLHIIKKSAENAETCMMVGSGSAIMAQTGLLYRRKMADCSVDKNWNRMFTAGIDRIPGAKVVADGKYYSCKDTFSSLEMTLWMIADLIDIDAAIDAAQQIGYNWDGTGGDEIFC